MNEYYYYGMAAVMLLTTCWTFAAVRWFHTCRAPKIEHRYIWPDRKLQVLVYLCSVVLLPYAADPTSEAAWVLMKSYLVGTWFFYCGLLLLCFFGTVKQWHQWRTVSWAAALIVFATILPVALNAWLPTPIMTDSGMRFWQLWVVAESVIMMGYAALAMYQVKRWLNEARDQNYSNPDDFPADYARRVWLAPVYYVPLTWPAYILDSPTVMAVQNVLLSVGNIVLLLNVMPVWRRLRILSVPEGEQADDTDTPLTDDSRNQEELISQTAIEIEAYVKDQHAFLNPHLKVDDVVSHCQTGRSYVSITFNRRFGSFAAYTNGLRLAHFEQYHARHPNETKESAALASGFSSYLAYHRALKKFKNEGVSQSS